MDIIAHKGDALVFVEVRTRKGKAFGSPEESITEVKKEKLKAVALHYLSTHSHLPPSWRIDVVVIDMDNQGKASRIELIENAIS